MPGREGADPTAGQIDVGITLGAGRVRVLALLVLRSLRIVGWLLIAVGVVVAVASGRFDEDNVVELTTVEGFVRAFFTPLVVLAAGFGIRLLVAPVAFLVALEVVASSGADVVCPERRSSFARLRDRLRLASAYRGLRWTVAAKYEAVDRLGPVGRTFRLAEVVLWVLVGVVAAGFVVMAGLR